MTNEFNLTPPQQQAWVALLAGKTPRGAKTAMAEAVARAAKSSKTGSWKTTVTGFFQGREKELRAIFEHPKRLRAAEEALGLDAGQFREWLEEITVGATQDGPLDVRVVGFEDYGPVPVIDAYFAPPRGACKIWLPPRSTGAVTGPSSECGGTLNIDELLARALPTTPRHAFAMVFCGQPGIGKTTTLKLLKAKLQQTGVMVTDWLPGINPAGGVILCDDLDLLDAGQRSLLCQTVTTSASVLLTATASSDALTDLPQYRAIYVLQDGYEQWSIEYIGHLERLLEHWGRTASLAPLRKWLEDDLFAMPLTNRLDNLGLIARHVADGGQLPPRYCDLARWAVARAAAQIRRRGESGAALLVEQYGEAALQEVAAQACRGEGLDVPIRTLIDAFFQAASGKSHPSKATAAQEASGLFVEAAEQLCHTGLIHKRGDRVVPTQPVCAVSALGAALVRNGEVDPLLLARVVLAPIWTDALVSAAERIGDGCRVLTALMAAPPGVLCQAVPAMTRVLAAGVPFTDASIYRQAFLLCLSAWARWPADQRAMTLQLGGPMNAAPPVPNYDRLVNGHAPLLVLAKASRLHRKLLPSQIDIEAVARGDFLPDVLRAYMTLLGTTEISAEDARDAVGLGAPFQSKVLLDSAFWRRLPPHMETGSHRTSGFNLDDYWRWWRIAGVPRLLELPDGEARVAGTDPDHSLVSALNQPPHGWEHWKNALASQMKRHHPRAAEVFAEAVLFTLNRGGRWNADAVKAVWDAVPGEKEVLRRAVHQQLLGIERVPEGDSLLLPWLLSIVIVAEDREELWDKWSTASPANVPWKLFVDAGLPQKRVATWALASVAQKTMAKAEEDRAWRDESKSANDEQALQALVAGDDVAVLELLIRSGSDAYKSLALERLLSLTNAPARRLKMELAGKYDGRPRHLLLANMVPERSEALLWKQYVAGLEVSPISALARWACYALVTEDSGPWTETLECLGLVNALLTKQPDGEALFATWCLRRGFELPNLSEYWQQLQTRAPHTVQARLADMASVTFLADKNGHPDPRPLVEAIMASPTIRGHVLAGMHAPLWPAALLYFGKERLIDILVEDHASNPNGTLIRLKSFQTGPLADLARSLLTHPLLGEAAARALAQGAYRNQPTLLSASLQNLSCSFVLDPEAEFHPVAAPLFSEYLRCAPDAALAWLTTELRSIPTKCRQSLWGKILPSLKPGPHRAHALAEYINAAPRPGPSN